MFSAQALLDSQGVALLDGAALEKARVSAIPGVAEGLRVELPQGMLLLFDDPWSSTATQCLQRLATAGARLALAQPAQLLQLRSRVSSEADSSVPTRPVPASGAEPASMAAGPVVAFVNEAIERAYADGASDIHFESDRQGWESNTGLTA
ncbi:hypothetical protein ACFQOZ_03100 [Comamonas endophytica]|uniref:hypothetical protein n=1 Tax=Comamonas endophytica TaxID=2949090 RepID=UPI0036156403